MDSNTIMILLVLALIAYIIMTYRQLLTQYMRLNEIMSIIKEKKHKSENTDIQRREYNRTVRAYNHKMNTVIGKIIAKRLNYVEIETIDKPI